MLWLAPPGSPGSGKRGKLTTTLDERPEAQENLLPALPKGTTECRSIIDFIVPFMGVESKVRTASSSSRGSAYG